MSQTIRTAGAVRVTLLSAWWKIAKVSGERGVQTAGLPSLFYLLTSASGLELPEAPSSDASCSSEFSLRKTGSGLGDVRLSLYWENSVSDDSCLLFIELFYESEMDGRKPQKPK